MPKMKRKTTHELAASLKPFSIAGIKLNGIVCPIIMFSNSNLVAYPSGSGSTYLPIKIDVGETSKRIEFVAL